MAAIAAISWLYFRPASFGDRVYRIGWMQSPPFQLPGSDGKAAGISVELVNEAARRRGIRLEWVYWRGSSESALVQRAVDLWPLITITPDRLKRLHISEPYLEHEYCFLVRADSPYYHTRDLAHEKIGMANISIDAHKLAEALPHAPIVARDTIQAVFDDVCHGATAAAFTDRYTAVTGLLQDSGCPGHALRWISAPQVRSKLGVGSTFEARAAADAIREEIGALDREGRLAGILGEWGFLSAQDLASVEALLDAERREIRLAALAGLFALLFAVACWQTVRLIGERNRSRKAEEALRESRERYLQAQKMESIGRLAGGVAHDFNNLLTIINGYSDLLCRQIPESDPIHAQVSQIRKAGSHAADLTQQLLAFGRKQVSRPRPLDLNGIISESEKMLRRLLGEDVELVTRLAPSLGSVMADPGHIHQVLMNLAVNARDAMPEGGTLSIETAEEAVNGGSGVRLTVRDSGQGMDEEVRSHIFEPFFTTKGTKGTGLGLATVYGIVQQSRGTIDVSSQPGYGTAFHIHLPCVNPDPAPAHPSVTSQPPRGSGTILVVEDQEAVREFASRTLRSRGFQVLEAADGWEALTLASRHPDPIDVLLTDVVLPGINGKDLATRLRGARPKIRIIYTSGYDQNLVSQEGVIQPGVAYLPKPFTVDQIADKVHEVMNDR
ncbi:MAG: transporter substrate-binding domain-containing protein [Acidobacteria bacterium]|nr:transporter substrate-binding domain-containing protein [Acidobacteriota bacterium]